jgi:hypothetical protein
VRCPECSHLIHRVDCPRAAEFRRAGTTVLWADQPPPRRRRGHRRGFVDREVEYAVRRGVFDGIRDLFR